MAMVAATFILQVNQGFFLANPRDSLWKEFRVRVMASQPLWKGLFYSGRAHWEKRQFTLGGVVAIKNGRRSMIGHSNSAACAP